MNSISYKASDHRDSDDDAQEITNFFLKIPTDCKKQTPRTLKSTYGRISFINACLRVQGMFQGYVGFVLENYLRPECPIQDMDRLKPESLTLLLDELSICKSNWSLQQNEGTNLSKVRSEKKKVTSFKTMYIIELQHKMSFFRENRYIGHTCAILFSSKSRL